MTIEEVMNDLAHFGNEQTKQTYIKHGAKEPVFGVKMGDLKKIQKKIKKDNALAIALFETGNSDAMYLAGLIADEKLISKEQLNAWCKQAYWYFLSEHAVAGITAESNYGLELGLEWIKSDKENIASAGWATLSNLAGIRQDIHLDKMLFTELLNIVENEIHSAQNRVRYTMNGFVISVGTHIASLTENSTNVALKIGKVNVNMGQTSCKVPLASAYIDKVISNNKIGSKRKSARS